MADFYLHHLVIHPLDEEGDKIEAEEDVQDKTLEGDEDCQENEDGDILDETLEEAGDLQEDEDSLVAFVIDYLHKGLALLESGYKVGVWRSGFRIIDLGMLFKVKKISFTFEQDDEAKTEESDIQDDSSDKEPFTLKTVGEPFTKILTAINESSKKNQIFESVSREFKGIASDIETTIMFASAGTLIPEEDSDFKDSREKILAMAQHLVSDIKAILTGTGQEKSSLVRAVEESLSTTSQLAVEVKRGAAGLSDTNQAGQVSPVDRQLYVENVCNTYRSCCSTP